MDENTNQQLTLEKGSTQNSSNSKLFKTNL